MDAEKPISNNKKGDLIIDTPALVLEPYLVPNQYNINTNIYRANLNMWGKGHFSLVSRYPVLKMYLWGYG